jgi:hypothetical protein
VFWWGERRRNALSINQSISPKDLKKDRSCVCVCLARCRRRWCARKRLLAAIDPLWMHHRRCRRRRRRRPATCFSSDCVCQCRASQVTCLRAGLTQEIGRGGGVWVGWIFQRHHNNAAPPSRTSKQPTTPHPHTMTLTDPTQHPNTANRSKTNHARRLLPRPPGRAGLPRRCLPRAPGPGGRPSLRCERVQPRAISLFPFPLSASTLTSKYPSFPPHLIESNRIEQQM